MEYKEPSEKEKQKNINNKLKEICNQLKNIPNIGLNYIEYMSALIYALFETKIEINIKDEIDTMWLIREIDKELDDIRTRENSYKLFINIRLGEVIDREYYSIIKEIIIKINKLIIETKRDKKILAKAFEYILMDAAENNDLKLQNGEFYTPKAIINTMVNLLPIKDNMAIYNPASGSGDFIVESAKKAKIYAFGEETNINNYNICMTNLWIHDIYNKRIQENIGENFRLADVAVGNPPFAGDSKEEINKNIALQDIYYKYGIPITASTYTKFLVMMLESINDNGQMAIILPHGFLFKKTNAECEVRKKLIRNNYIEAVISLPEKLFFNTKIPVVILIINKAKRESDVLFIDASREYSSKRKNNILSDKNINKIVETYRKKEIIQNYSYVAKIQEIEKNNYDLNIRKYVRFQQKTNQINQEETKEKIYELENEKRCIQDKINEILNNW